MKVELDKIREMIKKIEATEAMHYEYRAAFLRILNELDKLEADEDIKTTHDSICPYCSKDWKEEYEEQRRKSSFCFLSSGGSYNEGKIECPNCKKVFEYKFKDQTKPTMYLHTYKSIKRCQSLNVMYTLHQYLTETKDIYLLDGMEHIKTEVWSG